MAHNINFNNGKASFVSVREKAWHGLGTVVEEALTSSEAIKHAGLDYDVVKQPVYLQNGIEVPDTFANVRADNGEIFGTVGSRYEILQNRDAFKFFDAIVGEGEAIFQTAGALGKGETIFITAKLPSYITVGKDDLIEQYLFLTNNHNGKATVTTAFTPVRIVCNNTLNAALRSNSNRVRIMHNSQLENNLAEAHKMMGIINKMKTELEGIYNQMAKKKIVDAQLRDFLIQTFASKSQLETLAKGPETSGEKASMTKLEEIVADAYMYALTSDTQKGKTTVGTVFGAYNAITGYLQNVREVKDQETQLVSIMNGSGFDYTQKAFDLCTKML